MQADFMNNRNHARRFWNFWKPANSLENLNYEMFLVYFKVICCTLTWDKFNDIWFFEKYKLNPSRNS